MAKEINMQTNEAELKAVAKAVGSSLKRAGHSVPHSTVLHALAAALNKRDWHTLKASLEPTIASTPLPNAAPVQPTYEDRTWFFLRLAKAMGNAVSPVPAENSLALETAVSAVGPTIDGVLKWSGWNLPATLTFQTSRIDAGDFKTDKSAKVGQMVVRFKSGLQIDFEVGYSTADGWYVSSHGAKDFFEQLEAAVPNTQVLPLTNREALSPTRSLPGPTVKAEFWTDDRAFEVEFDAQLYLLSASDKALTAIMEVGYVGDSCTDAIAEYAAQKCQNDELTEAFAYLGAMQKSKHKDPPGFECKIDRDDYLRWMDAHSRPLLARMLCERADIGISEAQEEEIAGMWDWQRRETGDACDQSYATKEEAILAAYTQLNLLQEALDDLL